MRSLFSTSQPSKGMDTYEVGFRWFQRMVGNKLILPICYTTHLERVGENINWRLEVTKNGMYRKRIANVYTQSCVAYGERGVDILFPLFSKSAPLVK